MKRNRFSLILTLCLAALLSFGGALPALAAITATQQSVRVTASGRYVNWDGVSNVAQFKGADGNLWYAVNGDADVTIYKTENGAPVSGSVTLKKPHPLFGTALCDSSGNLYLVTGEANPTDDTDVETVFISKFDKNGKLIKTVGDNGSASLAWYYNDSFYSKAPFDYGSCDAAVNGNILTVNYAREMYSGHQSNSVFTVNTDDMSKVSVGEFYQSHSFAQRVVPTKDGFVYVGEGDCYDRAFTVYSVKLSGGTPAYTQTANVFDFWVEDGAFDAYNMYVVNNNFAHMGGLAALSNGKIAFASQSAQSLNTAAASETEEIFLQIFDPYQPLNTSSSYVTQGQRSGLAGNNGRTNVTNYGVKWLTSYGADASVSNVQIAATDQNEIVVLYELTRKSQYTGVWYMVLDEKGNVTCPATLFSAVARLNPCKTPVFASGAVSWVGNRSDDSGHLYIYRLTGNEEDCSVTNLHTWDAGKVTKAATCKDTGEKTFTCTVCNATKTETVAKDKNNHVGGTEVKNAKAATCAAAGYTGDTCCKGCGATLKTGTSIAKTTNHMWDAGKVTKAATCAATGVKTYTCSVCKATKTETIAKTTDHKWDAGKVTKAATCAATGVKTFTCSVCKTTKTETIAKTTDHKWDGGKVTKEATETAEGVKTYTCTVCKATKTEPIPKKTPGKVDFLLGDVDGNGIVEAADARLALRRAVNLENYAAGSREFLAADVTKDAQITAEDARLILRAAVGLEKLV